ncbi:HEAT repeat domain-containing protein [Acidobacteriota bacterium]
MNFFKKLFGVDIEQLKAQKNVKGLVKILKSQDRSERKSAVSALGEIGDTGAVEPLIDLLRADETLRNEAAFALGRIRDGRAVEPLIETMKIAMKADQKQCGIILDALGEIGDPRAVQPVIDTIKSIFWKKKGEPVRTRAEQALIKIGEPAVAPLVDLLLIPGSLKNPVKRIAAGLLAKLEWKPAEPGERFGYFWAVRKTAEIDAMGEAAVPMLIEALKDDASDVRITAATSLGRIGHASAAGALIRALKDRETAVCESAIQALGELRDRQAVEPLVRLMGERPKLKERALAALGNIGNENAVEALLRAFESRQGGTTTVQALQGIRNKRHARIVIDWLFEHATDYHTWMSDSFKNLFEDYADLILRITTYEVSASKADDRSTVHTYTYSLAKSMEALKKLSVLSSLVAHNLLHKVAGRKDLDVLTGKDQNGRDRFEPLNFDPMRRLASQELEKRNSPPYNPDEYLDEEAWKI